MSPLPTLLLLVSAALPGGCTPSVWRAGVALGEYPGTVKEVIVSPKGAVCLFYSARRDEYQWRIDPRERAVAVERVIQVPPSDIERFLARRVGSSIPEVSGEELRKFVRSSPSGRPDGASVKFSQREDQWKGQVVSFAYRRPSRDGPGVEARGAEEVTVTFHLPKGPPGGNLPWLPVRVLLTPPAIVADAAVGAVTIVTAPVWFPILMWRMWEWNQRR